MNHLTGRCLCGAIAYEIRGALTAPIYNCHCSKCRRWGGDAFRTSTKVKADQFRWTTGENKLAQYHHSPDVTKTFCAICGTNLISIYPNNPDYMGISLGGLEQDPGVKPRANIYVDSKAPWYDIEDSLPQFKEGPD